MKKIIALLLVVLTVFTLSGCNGYYTGHFYEAHCNSEELNVTRITVRLHNKEDVCCITYIYYELEYFDGDEVNIYIPKEVIVTESGKAYTVRSLGGQGMFRHSIYIYLLKTENLPTKNVRLLKSISISAMLNWTKTRLSKYL